MKVGVLRETRRWDDRRVGITPATARLITDSYPNIELYVQSSKVRIHPDREYSELGISVVDNIDHCDLLIGIKEVDEEELIPGKTYLIFSHVGKQQPYNRNFFREMVQKKITLIDYEYLTDKNNNRLVAFGFWAGVVGAYYAFMGIAKKTGNAELPPPEMCRNLEDLHKKLKTIKIPSLKLLVTGGGRVASGALEIIRATGIKEVVPHDFLEMEYDFPVFTRLDPEDYAERKEGKFNRNEFYSDPRSYQSTFQRYLSVTDVFIPCHFWDNRAPVFFTKEQVRSADFSISLIADISCDINGPVPTTIRTSTIENPFYDIDPSDLSEKQAFSSPGYITVMAVDNLPTALPLDASRTFSDDLYNQVFPYLFGTDDQGIIERGTILKNGQLTKPFDYLKNF